MLPLVTSAVKINGIYYDLNDIYLTARVTHSPTPTSEEDDLGHSYQNDYNGDIVIPSFVNYNEKEYCVTSIGESAFRGCSGLTSVVIPNTVTSIGSSAFAHCLRLTSVVIPNSVTSIGINAFYRCTGLTSVTIPNSVTSIGSSAFSGCSGLTSVTILNSMTSIDNSAFSGCKRIINVKVCVSDMSAFCNNIVVGSVREQIEKPIMLVDSKGAEIKDYVIPNDVTSIGGSAFSGCTGLTSVAIPNSVTSIGNQAFSGCTGLTSVNIPNNVTTIGYAAFNGCIGFTSITIPNSVTSIGNNAFDGCDKLSSVTVNWLKPVDISTNTFSNMENATLYVPARCWPVYMATNWGYFKEIVEISNTTYTLTYKVDNEVYKTYEMQVGAVITPETAPTKEGYTFSGWSEIPATMPAQDVTVTGTFIALSEGVSLDKSEVVVKKNNSVTLKATVNPSTLKDKSVTWKSSDESIATVSSTGKVKGIKSGIVTITCTSNATGAKASCKVTVATITLNKKEVAINKGNTVTLKPTVYPSELENKSVTWKTSDKTIATVTSAGVVKGVKIGTAVITCTSNATGLSTTCTVTVGYIKLDKTEVILEKNKSMTLKATVYPSELEDKSVTWKSSKTTVATVSSTGKVTGVKSGTAVITCTSNATGVSTTCKVTVGFVKLNKTEAILKKGKTMTLKATVYPTALEDKSVTWKSSDETIATVTSAGKGKGVKSGTATITCTSNATGLSTTCTVTVGTVILNISGIILNKGNTMTLKAAVYPETLEDKSVTWESSDKTIATVTSSGKVKGIAAGAATITCTSVATGLSTTCKVTVTDYAPARTMLGEDDVVTDIEIVEETPAVEEPFDVYDLRGHRVLHQVTSLDGLPAGVYIVNGKKVLKK